MSEDELARKLFYADSPPNPHPWSPYGRQPSFDDLWPVDQERYYKMAREIVRAALKEGPRHAG